MKEILTNKFVWLLVIMVLGVAFIGGLESKKDAEQVDTHYITDDLQK